MKTSPNTLRIGIAVAVIVIYRASFLRARANRRATPAALDASLAGSILKDVNRKEERCRHVWETDWLP